MQGVQISSHDKAASQAIRGLLAGSAPNGETPDVLGGWWPTYEKLCEAYNKNGTELVRKTFNALANGNADLAQLITTQQKTSTQKQIKTKSENMIAELNSMGYHFKLNALSDTLEVNDIRIDDYVLARIRTQMRDRNINAGSALQDAILTEAERNSYNPISDYLNNLKWDGKNHIAHLASLMPSNDPLIRYPSGTALSPVYVYLYRWLIGAVAKALDGHQNLMFVLVGPQGCGKSYFARWLCSGIPSAFIEEPIEPDEKDCELRLASYLVWEVAELDSTTRRADVSALKAFITKQKVTARRAYARFDTEKKAVASLIGTVNFDSGFLVDSTGNRRFMVTEIQSINKEYTKIIDVNQVWAQAVQLYRNGTDWRLSPEEESYQTEQNKRFEVETVLDGWIRKYFNLHASPDSRLNASEIVEHLRKKDIRLTGSERSQSMEIARSLKKFGIKREHTRDGNEYIGISPRE
jgi:predicted P-loop ATPase